MNRPDHGADEQDRAHGSNALKAALSEPSLRVALVAFAAGAAWAALSHWRRIRPGDPW